MTGTLYSYKLNGKMSLGLIYHGLLHVVHVYLNCSIITINYLVCLALVYLEILSLTYLPLTLTKML
jgi:hypothetical protein